MNSRDELPAYFKHLGYKVGVEIGVYKAEFTEKLLRSGLMVFGVDPYITYKNYRKHPREENYEKMFLESKKLIEYLGGELIRKTSMDAVDSFQDGGLDFIYIDGNHSFPYVAQDIYQWYPKIKVGGCISGHDYFNDSHNPYWIRACHVKHAVDASVKIFNANLQVLSGDKHPSWLWIKKA